MANASGDLMTHSFVMMGLIVIAIYLAVVIGKILIEKMMDLVTGKTVQERRAQKIMARLQEEEEAEKARVLEAGEKSGSAEETHVRR